MVMAVAFMIMAVEFIAGYPAVAVGVPAGLAFDGDVISSDVLEE